jgi:hypothetical protein
MVTLEIYTDITQLTSKEFDDMARAERYAMNILGTFTSHGTISLVRVTDSMLGETTEFEY